MTQGTRRPYSEAEVKEDVYIKIVVRSQKGMDCPIAIQNFRVLAYKMTQLWLFWIVDIQVEVKV